MDLSVFDVVLVRPARAANVAAACRAMKNMGLRSLWLVGDAPGLDEPEARALAYGAWDLLDGARRAASLRHAVRDCVLVVGTSGRPLAEAWTPRRLAQEAAARGRAGRVAVVFGPEATGLARDEMDLCHALVRIPTDPDHPSLNLAQAVLLVAYELRLAALESARPPGSGPHAATAGELEAAIDDLRHALLAVGYLNPQNPEAVLTELRRLLARAGLTSRESGLLRGVARQVLWAARTAGPDPPRVG